MGRARRCLALAPREAHVAPDMERQAGHANTSGQPTDGILAHGKNARSVRFLELGLVGCATQPNDGTNRGIDPRRWSHQVLLALSVAKLFLNFASWNLISGWLARLDGLRRAA